MGQRIILAYGFPSRLIPVIKAKQRGLPIINLNVNFTATAYISLVVHLQILFSAVPVSASVEQLCLSSGRSFAAFQNESFYLSLHWL